MGILAKVRPVLQSRWVRELDPRTIYFTCGDDSILRGWVRERANGHTKELAGEQIRRQTRGYTDTQA